MPLSFSQLSTYRRCPRMFEYANVKKIPRGISEAESFGSSVHNCLKRWGELEMEIGRRALGVGQDQMVLFDKTSHEYNDDNPDPLHPTPNTLLEFWHQSFIINTYASRVEADFARERGERLMEQFYAWSHLRSSSFGGQGSGEVWKVIAVEKSFSIDVNGSVLKGRFDRVESDGDSIRVIDFKTSPPRSQDQVDADLQLSIYAMAIEEIYKQPCGELMFLFLSDEGVVERSTTRSENQLNDARKQIKTIEDNMDSKDFHPTPSAGVCRCCPYKGVCDVAAA
ncbi:MAG: PD-(D/E)XK nuclease family protein [Kiritimatiellales bacterium]|nr:PD-(D/E)XK nuclease family protein [Kiritimatiellales bacterium]